MLFVSVKGRILFRALARLYFHVAPFLPRLILHEAYLAAHLFVRAGAKLQVHHLRYFLYVDDFVVDFDLEVL